MNIDELIVRLVLDPKGFVAGTKEANAAINKFKQETKQHADEVERQATKMSDGFSKVTKELLGLGLAIAGISGFKDLVVGTVSAANAQGLLARSLDVSIEKFNQWVNVAKKAGMGGAAAESDINSLIMSWQAVREHSKTPEQAGLGQLMKLGVTDADFQTTWENFAMQMIRALSKDNPLWKKLNIADNPASRALAAQALPGGQSMLAIANQFPLADLPRVLAESITLRQEEADAARRLTEKLEELRQAIEDKLNQLIPKVEPPATKTLESWKSLTRGDISGAIRQGNEAHEMLLGTPLEMGLWEELKRRWNIALGGGVDTFSDRFGSSPPQLRDRFGNFPMPQERPRILPPPGGEKIPDRFHGNITGSTDNSKSVTNHITNNLVTPPNATPQMLSGLIGSAVVQATIGVA
jgi:hypothetical protein